MSNYRPDLSNSIPLVLLVPTWEISSGVRRPKFPTIEEALEDTEHQYLFFGTFKTYGGTEKNINGVYSIEDTANIETWFRPDIKSDCRVARANDSAIFEIINEPEDINQRHQFLKFRAKRIKGGA